jgi:transcriptional/translational regulatory protein YebC/TACO1
MNEDQFKANMKMLERFEEDDDVQNVFTIWSSQKNNWS